MGRFRVVNESVIREVQYIVSACDLIILAGGNEERITLLNKKRVSVHLRCVWLEGCCRLWDVLWVVFLVNQFKSMCVVCDWLWFILLSLYKTNLLPNLISTILTVIIELMLVYESWLLILLVSITLIISIARSTTRPLQGIRF